MSNKDQHHRRALRLVQSLPEKAPEPGPAEREAVHALMRKNADLRRRLERSEQKRRDLALGLLTRIDRLVLPLLDQLAGQLSPAQRRSVNLIRRSLEEVSTPLAESLSDGGSEFTPRELEICHLVRYGLSCKQIASVCHTSEQTVLKQRKHIRRKLGIAKRRIDLKRYLQSISLKRPQAAGQPDRAMEEGDMASIGDRCRTQDTPRIPTTSR